MKRKLTTTLLVLTLSAGFAFADDTWQPGGPKSGESQITLLQQIETIWGDFIAGLY